MKIVIVMSEMAVFPHGHIALNTCIYQGLPRSWWEGSERHIQLSVVEHHPQFKALPVSVSPGFYP
ncbi:hypothetical protein, partial [Salmonella enterica]|uniref:hypothetical protein n=1 Tax=Salmonella enterica TaxID=28901 RepID=UPI002DB635E4